jgi:hypothetical protein
MFKNNRVSPPTALVAAVMITVCANYPVEAAISPSNPEDIMALGKRLTQNRLSLFSFNPSKYTFYVGEVLEATYDTTSNILRISSLTYKDKVVQTCEYSSQGILFIDPKDHTNKDAFVSTCNRLVESLNKYMSR